MRRTPRVSAPIETPEVPADFDEDEARIFEETAFELKRLGIAARIDGPLLAVYASAVVNAMRAQAQLRADGPTVVGHRGAITKHPAAQLFRDNAALALSCARQLGLSPASRQGIAPGQEEDERDEFMRPIPKFPPEREHRFAD